MTSPDTPSEATRDPSNDPQKASSGPSRRPRRWLRRIAFALLLLIAAVAAFPFVAGAIAPPIVTNELEKRLNARATLEDVDVSWRGRVNVRGLALDDLAGRPLLSVARVDVDADVRSAIDGLYRATVDVDGFEVHVRRGEDGRLNLQDVVRPRAGGDDEDGASDDDADAPPPRVEARVRVKNGRVVIHGDAGETEFVDVRFDADVPSLAEPTTFSAGLGVVGPDGPGGTIDVSGSAVPLPSPGANVPRATAHVKVDALLLRALAPALALALPGAPPTGRVDVDLDVELLETLAVRGGGEVRVTDLVVPARREGMEPVRFGAITMTSRANLAPDLSGAQQVRVEVADLLTLDYEGALAPTDDGGTELAGKVTVDGSLGRLTEVAAAFAPLERGVSVRGRLSSTTDFHLRAGDAGLRRASLTTATSLVDLEATGPDGPLDLGSLTRVEVDLSAQGDVEKGTARLSRLDARLGPVAVRGNAAASGIDPKAFDLQALRVEDSRFEIDADLDRLVADLRPLVDLGPHGIAGDLAVVATARQEGKAVELTADVRPNGLVAKGITVDAAPLAIRATVTPEADRVDARASLETERLAVTLADGRRVEQKGLRARADVEHKRGADVLTLRDAGLRTDTAEIDLKGRVLAATDPAERTAELAVDLRTALEVLRRDLGAFLGDLPYDGRGAVASHVDLRARGEDVTVEGATTLRDLDVTVKGKDATKPPLRVQEPEVVLDVDAALATGKGRVDIARLGVSSLLLRGKLSGAVDGLLGGAPAADGTPPPRVIVLDGITGEFFYVPDRLAVLLAPYLPGEMKGKEEERVTFDLNGRLEDLDVASLLQSSKGGVHVGLGTLKVPGLETGGEVALELTEGRAALTGDLGANGGTIDLLGDLGKADPAKAGGGEASLKVDVKDLAVDARLGQFLALAHPLLAAAGEGLDQNKFGGIVQLDLHLAYGEPLTLDRLIKSWKTLEPRLLEGGLHFQIDQAKIEGSPLLAQLLEKIDVPVGQELAISPVDMTIADGKLTYAKPWSWTFGDVKTNFTGSIGFDKKLDLGWNVPITKKLVKKYDFLKSLKGEAISIPLTGTTSQPNLQWDGIFQQLAEKAVKSRLQDEIDSELGDLGKKIPGLEDILGGDSKPTLPPVLGPKTDLPPTSPSTPPVEPGDPGDPAEPADPDAPPSAPAETMPTDPAEILKRADSLWNAGDEKGARKYYKELKKKHALTLVFLLNKDRIEDRAKK